MKLIDIVIVTVILKICSKFTGEQDCFCFDTNWDSTETIESVKRYV